MKYQNVKIIRHYGREIGASPDGEIFVGPLFILDKGLYKSYSTRGSKNSRGYMTLGITLRGGSKFFLAHRLIAEIFLEDYSEDLLVNHINGNKTDNRLSNLEMATNSENITRYRKPKSDKFHSQFRGVTFIPKRNRWRAVVKNWQRHFKCEIDAAKAWDKQALKMGYKKEYLNFPF